MNPSLVSCQHPEAESSSLQSSWSPVPAVFTQCRPLKRRCCSVTKLWPTLHDPMEYSTAGFPVPHHVPELAQVHVHGVSNAISNIAKYKRMNLGRILEPGSYSELWEVCSNCPLDFQTVVWTLWQWLYLLPWHEWVHGDRTEKCSERDLELNTGLPHPEQQSANLCRKGPDGEYFQLHGSYNYCHNGSTLLQHESNCAATSTNVTVFRPIFTRSVNPRCGLQAVHCWLRWGNLAMWLKFWVCFILC